MFFNVAAPPTQKIKRCIIKLTYFESSLGSCPGSKYYVYMTYDEIRAQYKPQHIALLFIAESPPPSEQTNSSRQFYRTTKIYPEDRLYVNTIRALYPETLAVSQADLQAQKEIWLRRFQADGYYMIEALEESQPHKATKKQRQERIAAALPRLIERVKALVSRDTKIILIKSNVYDVAAEPLREAGFTVLNKELVDYPGRFNQKAYREKVAALITGT